MRWYILLAGDKVFTSGLGFSSFGSKELVTSLVSDVFPNKTYCHSNFCKLMSVEKKSRRLKVHSV